jgi:3-dehydroquinate synthase
MHGRVRLDLDFSPDRYECVIGEGILAEIGPKTARLVTSPSCVLVTDTHVAATPHVGAVEASLRRAGFAPKTLVVPAGEGSKSAQDAAVLWESFAEAGLEAEGVVVAVGGGVVGDLAGFCAATWMRGVALIHVPTTLLAMCDSAIGGKTALNLTAGKNLVGAFHQPRFVLSDVATLDTLPDRELRSGFGEIVKSAILRDRQSLRRLAEAAPRLLARDRAETIEAVRLAVETKADHVKGDVEDRAGRRMLLNLGHTTGHAIEAETGYGRVTHGEAVAAGLVVAARIAGARGLCGRDLVDDVSKTIVSLGLSPNVPADVEPAGIVARTRHDKKRRRGRRRMVLPHARGGAGLYDVDDAELLAAINRPAAPESSRRS